MLKQTISILAVILIIGCAGASKDPVVNNTTATNGDTIWKSEYTEGSVQIDKSLKFVGSDDKNDQRVTRKYYLFEDGNGTSFYLVDVRIKGSWSFPEDYDHVLGKNQDPKDPYLLKFEPKKYSIWKGMSKRSYRTYKALGVSVPECKIAVEKGKIGKSRKSGFWTVLVKASSCDNTPLEINKAMVLEEQLITIN